MEENNNNEEVLEIKQETGTENDGIKIANDVIAVIAGVAVSEVQGVYGMSGGFAGRNIRSFKWKEKPSKRN